MEELDAASSWSRVFVIWREENWEAKSFKMVMAVWMPCKKRVEMKQYQD
jgi:hypothetical protein